MRPVRLGWTLEEKERQTGGGEGNIWLGFGKLQVFGCGFFWGGGIRRGSPNIWRGFGFKIASIRCVLNFSVHAKSLAQRKQARIY